MKPFGLTLLEYIREGLKGNNLTTDSFKNAALSIAGLVLFIAKVDIQRKGDTMRKHICPSTDPLSKEPKQPDLSKFEASNFFQVSNVGVQGPKAWGTSFPGPR